MIDIERKRKITRMKYRTSLVHIIPSRKTFERPEMDSQKVMSRTKSYSCPTLPYEVQYCQDNECADDGNYLILSNGRQEETDG